MQPIVKSLADYLEILGDGPYSLSGTPNQIRVAFPEGETLILKDGTVKETLRSARPGAAPALPTPAAPTAGTSEEKTLEEVATPKFTSKFTEDDYPALQKLVEVSKTFIIAQEGDDDPITTVKLGSLHLEDSEAVPGSLLNQQAWKEIKPGGLTEWYSERLRFYTLEEDKLAVEVKYFPILPTTPEEAAMVFLKTSLMEVMEFEDFHREITEKAKWTTQLFTYAEDSYLTFETVTPGENTTADKDEEAEIGDKLLVSDAITFLDKELEVHLWEYED